MCFYFNFWTFKPWKVAAITNEKDFVKTLLNEKSQKARLILFIQMVSEVE